MSFFEDGIEQTLATIKKELKEWESTFERQNGRRPEKKDISKNTKIGSKYEKYRRLRSTVQSKSKPPTQPTPTSKVQPVAATAPLMQRLFEAQSANLLVSKVQKKENKNNKKAEVSKTNISSVDISTKPQPESPKDSRAKKRTKIVHEEAEPTKLTTATTTTDVNKVAPVVIKPTSSNEEDVISDIGGVVSANSYLLCESKWKVSKSLSRYQEILQQFELLQKQLQEQKEAKVRAKEITQLSKTNAKEDNIMDDIMDYYLEDEDHMEDIQPPTMSLPDSDLRKLLKNNFGYSKFREGQLECIKRVTNLKSTLLILPTGSGKSLCYQFPVLLLPSHSIIIVISPLLSLINDQLNQLPHCITAATINSQQSENETDDVLKNLRNGKIKLLYLSPEKFTSESFIKLLKSKGMPSIHFVCIDEAHCLSEWSHNFRTSYLRLNSVIRKELKVKCILALTATATKMTEDSIVNLLDLENSSESVLRLSSIRKNLHITVSKDQDKYKALISVLKNDIFKLEQSPIIIYCNLQHTTDDLANHLKHNQFNAQSYHAGKSASERKKIQNQFMNNEITIIVATVAFGMGIDKQDIRAVIHFNLPRSVENYVQEIGRAGRDGESSYCHLFLSLEDYTNLKSLCYADTIDQNTIKKFLKMLFQNKQNNELVAIPEDKIQIDLDTKLEVLQTLLSYLQINGYLEILPDLSTVADVGFLNKPPQDLANQNQLVACFLKFAKKSQGIYSFSLIDVANNLGLSVQDINRELMRLKKEDKEISCEWRERGSCIQIIKCPEDIDNLCSILHNKIVQLEDNKLSKLNTIWNITNNVSYQKYTDIVHTSDSDKSVKELQLHNVIEEYFTNMSNNSSYVQSQSIEDKNKNLTRGDIITFLKRFYEPKITGRVIARIFHGLSSPAFSSQDWCRCGFWGRHKDYDFQSLISLATQEIIHFKSM